MNTFNLTLDLNKSRASSPVRLRQGDAQGTTITALVLDHGATADLTGMTAQLVMELPDGTQYYRKSASISGNSVSVLVDETQAASVSGRTANAYFQMLQGTTVKASTGSFAVEVLPDALEGHTVPESYDSAIQDAIDALDAAVEQMPDMVEDVLADHPEWTTTVQDGSVSDAKLYQGTNGILARVQRLQYRLANMLTNTLPEGDVATATDAAKTPVAGLALYGKSTQAGTPTPSAPVPIVSVAPDSQGNISLRAQRTSDASTYTVTPIDLDGHELRSLPDGTRDELTVDERGHAVLVQRVGEFTITQDLANAAYSYANLGTYGRAVMWVSTSITPAAAQVKSDNGLCTAAPWKSSYTENSIHAYVTNSSNASLVAVFAQGSTAVEVASKFVGEQFLYEMATPVTHDLGTIDPVPLCGPDLTAQAVPTAPFALTYERDLNTTLARLESAIAELATN